MSSLSKIEITETDIKTLAQAGVIPQNAPPAQVAIFSRICSDTGLNPFLKEIYLVGYNNQYSIITGIDGFRNKAAETGMHAGTEDCKFDLLPDGAYKTVAMYKQGEMPISATVTVYKAMGGQRVPFTHTASFKEFSTGKQKWQSMPFQMIAKVAEAFALRKAFPDKLNGLRSEEELGAIHNEATGAKRQTVEIDVEAMAELKEIWAAKLKQVDSVPVLAKLYQDAGFNANTHPEIAALFGERKREILTEQNA